MSGLLECEIREPTWSAPMLVGYLKVITTTSLAVGVAGDAVSSLPGAGLLREPWSFVLHRHASNKEEQWSLETYRVSGNDLT
jgi:hypothetical protein